MAGLISIKMGRGERGRRGAGKRREEREKKRTGQEEEAGDRSVCVCDGNFGTWALSLGRSSSQDIPCFWGRRSLGSRECIDTVDSTPYVIKLYFS